MGMGMGMTLGKGMGVISLRLDVHGTSFPPLALLQLPCHHMATAIHRFRRREHSPTISIISITIPTVPQTTGLQRKQLDIQVLIGIAFLHQRKRLLALRDRGAGVVEVAMERGREVGSGGGDGAVAMGGAGCVGARWMRVRIGMGRGREPMREDAAG